MNYTDSQIKQCLKNITHRKYHKYIKRVNIMNSRLQLFNLKFLIDISFDMKYIKDVLNGIYNGVCIFKNSNIYLFSFNYKSKEEAVLITMSDSLHEIRHAYIKEYNSNFYSKYKKVKPDLRDYFKHPLEKDAQNFAVTIMNKNMNIINSEMDIDVEWNFNYI